MSKLIALIPGDGIGPEVIKETIKVLNVLAPDFKYIELDLGGVAIDKYGVPFPDETKKKVKEVDAVLMAAIGGPKYDNLPREKRPETGLLALRKELNAFANIRPAMVFDSLAHLSTLKTEVVRGTDLVVVRELTGGIYFGQPTANDGQKAYNTAVYTVEEIERIAKVAFEFAQKRSKKLCSVDKANVLNVSQLWRDVVTKLASNYPDVELSHMYVDNAAMQLIKNPKQFDVIVTSNLFGDILSDEASMLTGSIGLLPSASLGDGTLPGLYEPVHGSAPDIAGKGLANPVAMMLSAAMMLRYSFSMNKEADILESAIKSVLDAGILTADLGGKSNTLEIGEAVLNRIKVPV
ncbi:MAG: 3-isopropylmalate dehydrogenase [Candidatus Caenarcaniphilales bacterium]|jgi:3-isopropylmalate dehydrogenase|nr:3-isopropylmalate dehydrogenase [Candidatus Caenarcaniphilales bacterium]